MLEGESCARLYGDQERLGQVIINLLTNAIKYSPRANSVLVRLHGDGAQVEVAVQDFGVGIDEAHHQRIFERFYQVCETAESTYPGLGIGHYIAKTIVMRHGGTLCVESRKGEGSTFRVTLPLRSTPPQATGVAVG